MEFGICMFVTNYSMQAADLAQAVEERDFDALFIPDHTHIPASRQSPFTIGEELPPDYSHNVDVFLALAAAAAVTKRIRLGTGICLVVERDPVVMVEGGDVQWRQFCGHWQEYPPSITRVWPVT